MGMVLLFAFAFGAVAPVVMGLVKDSFDNLAPVMASLSAFFVAGAAIILVARIFFLRRDYVGK
jgi:uncharacterized membrane protein YdcZ (DUF606 family)